MLRRMKRLPLFLLAGITASCTFGADPVYQDSKAPAERRAEDLLGRMTLEEKIGQMNMPCVYESGLGEGISAKMAGVKKFAAGTLVRGLGPAGGFFTLPNTILHEGTKQQAEFLNSLQKIAREETRLGIPLLQTEEGTHGLMCPGATIFPEGTGLASSWDLELFSRVYSAAAREARAIGVHQLFTLVVEPIRDPRLGRNQEAYSEDPFLCARFAETIVRAVQGTNVAADDKVVSGLCHYPGQSQPVSGLERGSMEISERLLREVFLVPWQAGVRDAGALGVMATYPSIDAVPTHASSFLLTRVLRDEFRFDGLVLCEGGGIGTLVYEQLARDQKQAGQLALAAGVDVGISFESGYMGDLIESVQEGMVPMQLVDRAVMRILKQKIRLGLFEKPYVNVERAVETVHRPEHQAIALEAARKGIVLLKNSSDLLPLRQNIKAIAVIGPNADDGLNQLGDYAPLKVPQEVITVLAGIKSLAASGTTVTCVKGCNVLGNHQNEIARATEAARNAEIAVVVLGENERRAANHAGTDGEGFDAATLELTGLQEELVKSVHATGTPTVVVLINGRPLATRWIASEIPAIVEAWLPGERGGQAVAEVLFGKVNPSGKLTVSVARHAGQLPVFYNARKSKRYWLKNAWGRPYVDLEPTPLYPFGHGLSYTRFEYSNLTLSRSRTATNESVEVHFDVKNIGARAGAEVAQIYIEDLQSSVATPSKELRGFVRVNLEPGETHTCTVRLDPDHLALLDKDLRRVVEPGEFKIMVGASSEDIRLETKLTVR
jgi:beta-glucosidase